MTVHSWIRAAAIGAFLVAPIQTSSAQVCLGAPARGAFSYQHARYTIGTGHGVDLAVPAGAVAFALRANTRSMSSLSTEATGFDGSGNIAISIPVSRVRLCPGIAVGYSRMKWDMAEDFGVQAQNLSLRAGAAIGMEQHLYKGLSLIPAIGVYYDFTVAKFDPSGDDDVENVTTGDTLSQVAIDYSVALRYRFVYAGMSAARYTDTPGIRPVSARYFVGFAFGSGRRDD